MARANPTRVLVKLKLRLMRAGLELSGMRGKVAFGFAYLLAVGFGLSGAVMFALLRGVSDQAAGDVTRLVFTGLLFTWALGPILFAASENTLEVDRLAMFPLGARDLMPGLLLASVVGFGGLATVLFLVGGVVGLTPVSGYAVVTVAAFVLELGVCIAASRLVSTWMSALVRKRHWRDVVLTAAPLIGVAISLSGQLVNFAAGPSEPGELGPSEEWQLSGAVRTVLRLLPSGPAGEAAAAARNGQPVEALAGLLGGAVMLVGLTYLWWRGMVRVMTTADESTSGRTATSHRPAPTASRRPALFPRLLWWLPAGRVGAVAAKELRLLLRDPRQRASLIAIIFPAVFPVFTLRAAGTLSESVVLIAASAALFYGGVAMNSYGFDGPRFWMHVAAGDDAERDLLGKNLAVAITTGAIVLVEAVILAAISSGWTRVPAALGLAALALAVMVGLGNVTSVSNPVAIPDSRTNVWAQDAAKGAQLIGPTLLAMFATAVIVGPFAVASLLWPSPAPAAALIAAELTVGWLVWRAGLRRALKKSAHAQADLLSQLEARRAV